ncbi:hypothetical protein DNX55_02600 [Escherichia coli]|uniref:Uncharacterized protein n=1 Tax=Shigella sonnei TaxID=624 RepID=A0AAE5N6K8_SHISO|nr:hypothetical protein BWL12_12870 [Escherichia coli]AUG17041.1 hypothetical protein CXP41_12670 [Escherichia coli str. K-12 substr. MG1655]EFI87697.1 hypothetical protein HMPREF9551_03314 [Escherichia coli MS 196-1]EFJ66531.1 hypothetical protein HMPREF9547_02268 [Escherichia coli MS 175-1]EFO2082493.1 hypothetical protein [Escherichia coli O109]EFO2121909.1 hypothetical protein [Escherichia coli O106]OYG68939.1 hypothetical protein CI732_24570 [Shigella boydii]OYG95168.1 hypothetical prot
MTCACLYKCKCESLFHSRAASLVIREHVPTAMVRRHQEQGSVIYPSILPQKPFIYKGHCELSDAKLCYVRQSNLLLLISTSKPF